MDQATASGGSLGLFVAALTIYLLPWAVAALRAHRSRHAIGALNVLLGWTALGWLAALVWSLTGSVEDAGEADRVPCPLCAEPVRPEARRCRYCGGAIDPPG